eukprot:scaffold4756_cov357-Prasinococcus_capsulatus_cf.AAC.2
MRGCAATCPCASLPHRLTCSPGQAELDFGVEESLPELESVAPIWGLGKSVKVAEGPFGRGLFATRDIARGENIISVPLTACLVAEREEALYAPGASWEELTGGRVQGYERLQGFYEQYPLPWVSERGVSSEGRSVAGRLRIGVPSPCTAADCALRASGECRSCG